MAADLPVWNTLIEHLEKMVTARRARLAPLLSGEGRLGRRGPDTDGQWVDITDLEAQSLRNEITSLQHTIERVRKEQG
jgi:hypothetical protein